MVSQKRGVERASSTEGSVVVLDAGLTSVGTFLYVPCRLVRSLNLGREDAGIV